MSDAKMVSLADALRDGSSPDEIMAGFQKALKEAQDEVAAERAKSAAQERKNEKQEELDELREEAVSAVIEYLEALLGDPCPEEIQKGFYEAAAEIEKDFQRRLPMLRMLRDIAKSEDEKKDCKDNKNCACGKEKMNTPDPDVVLKAFLNSLR